MGLRYSGEEYVARSAICQPVGVCVTVHGSIWWDGNASTVVISAKLLWSTNEQVGGVVIFDVGRNCET